MLLVTDVYLDQEQIQSMQDVDVVESSMVQAVEVRQIPSK
jgi:hypothetical protein